MPVPEFNLDNIPEPLRSILRQLDPGNLAQMASGIDPRAALNLFSGTLGALRQSMHPQQAQMLEQLLQSLVKAMAGPNSEGK